MSVWIVTRFGQALTPVAQGVSGAPVRACSDAEPDRDPEDEEDDADAA